MARPAIVAEKAGIPSVTISAAGFLPLVAQLGEAEGISGLRAAKYPGTFSVESEGVIRDNLEKVTFEQIIQALTNPVENSAEASEKAANLEEVAFRGSLEEVNAFFTKNGWTDGLPIVPPNTDKVSEFLKYTDRSPHEQIATLAPGNLAATPWSVAVNAVMAGCHPKHMPILIAAVEAIGDPHYNLEQAGTTAGLIPFLIINGPIIEQLQIKYGLGLVSLQPNVVIGRWLGLIIRNIAGLRPAEQYVGTFGYTMPFVLAEDEANSPWEPFHVERGFGRNTSTVTAGGTCNWGFQAFPSGTDAESLLKIICREIVKNVNLMISSRFGHGQMMTVLITPSVASGGYSRKDVEKFLFDNSKVKIGEVSFESKYGDGDGAGKTIRQLIGLAWDTPKEWASLGPDDTVPAMAYPGLIHVIVCGDRTRNKAMALHSMYSRPTPKEIKLPSNWNDLI